MLKAARGLPSIGLREQVTDEELRNSSQQRPKQAARPSRANAPARRNLMQNAGLAGATVDKRRDRWPVTDCQSSLIRHRCALAGKSAKNAQCRLFLA